jgi:hypothetical protein
MTSGSDVEQKPRSRTRAAKPIARLYLRDSDQLFIQRPPDPELIPDQEEV